MASLNRRRATPPGPDVPVFVISVAAELTGLHPQTLRTYDRIGLVSPGRTDGGGRRYSLHDIELLREVAELTTGGIGLEGVRRILELKAQVATLQARGAGLRARVTELENLVAALAEQVERSSPNLPVLRGQVTLTATSRPSAPAEPFAE